MRAFIVEAVYEVIEPGLLLKKVVACRFGGLQLQGEMHAFMASVLLRVTGFDTLDLNTKAQPPN